MLSTIEEYLPAIATNRQQYKAKYPLPFKMFKDSETFLLIGNGYMDVVVNFSLFYNLGWLEQFSFARYSLVSSYLQMGSRYL
jgi:hypothetical protein